MSGFTVLAARRNRGHNAKERWVANAGRHESVQLRRRLQIIGLQQQRELARVRWAQLELTRTLDQLRTHRPAIQHTLTQPGTSPARLRPLHLDERSCCPNHIMCSSCNLRLRLADVLLHRFTPALWTMYCPPLPNTCTRDVSNIPEDVFPSFPSFKKSRHFIISGERLGASDPFNREINCIDPLSTDLFYALNPVV